jgi:hypothetical protein
MQVIIFLIITFRRKRRHIWAREINMLPVYFRIPEQTECRASIVTPFGKQR